MSKITIISDTHSKHHNMVYDVNNNIDFNTQNILIHCGDISSLGLKYEIENFLNWFKSLKNFDYKIFIAGNHDFYFEEAPYKPNLYPCFNELLNPKELLKDNVYYLQDSELLLDLYDLNRPLKIYGSPWSPKYNDWAFNIERNSEELKNKWDKIPDDVDILITHTPPFGYLDINKFGQNVGCEMLKNKIDTISPLIHCYGHIHEDYRVSLIKETFFVNASISNIYYKPNNKPISMDISLENDKIIVNYE